MGFETTSYPDALIYVGKNAIEPICTLKNASTGERYQIAVSNDSFKLYRGTYHEYDETNDIPYEVWETIRSLNAPSTYKPKVDYNESVPTPSESVPPTTVGDLNEEQFKEFLRKLDVEKNGVKSPFSVESRAGLVAKTAMPEHWISNAAQRTNDTDISTISDPNLRKELENKNRSIEVKSR